MAGYTLLLFIFVWPYLVIPFNYIACLQLLLQIMALLIAQRLPTFIIRQIFHIYAICSLSLALPNILVLSFSNETSGCLWYIITPLTIYVVLLKKRQLIYWTLFCLFQLLLVQALPYFVLKSSVVYFWKSHFPSSYTVENPVETWPRLELSIMATFLAVFGIVCFSVYYIHKLQRIQLKLELQNNLSDSKLLQKTEIADEKKDDRHADLYYRIVEYIEKQEPFTNPDFTITQLASAMDVNIAYISSAIKTRRNMSFNLFVNTYRIEKIKHTLQHDPNKYTLESLALSAGFRNQSAFNKAFKLCEGVTPTVYKREEASQG
jgi:AraC-like DNA-binding protein